MFFGVVWIRKIGSAGDRSSIVKMEQKPDPGARLWVEIPAESRNSKVKSKSQKLKSKAKFKSQKQIPHDETVRNDNFSEALFFREPFCWRRSKVKVKVGRQECPFYIS